MPTHPESMQILWKLVEIDDKLVHNAKAEAKAKAELAKVEKRATDAHSAQTAARTALMKSQAAQKDAEAQLKQLEVRLHKMEMEVQRNSGAYDKERAHADDLETRSLEMLDTVQRDQKTEVKAKAEVEATQVQLKAAKDVAAAALKVLHDEADALRALRASTAAPVAAPVMEVYESANRTNPGSGLCRIKERQCLGCGTELTMHHAVGVRANDHIVRCPDCGRIQDVPKADADGN